MRDMTDRVIVGDPVKKMKDNTYSSMFNYFNNRYGGDTDSTNYIHVIKSMKKESKISDLVKTYNRVLKKLLLLTYGKEEFISDLWVEYGLTCDTQWVWNNIKEYLNDQIKRVFDENPYSDKLALECITNLREGTNEGKIRKYIASKSSDEVNAKLKTILACKKTVKEAPKHMSKYNTDTNDYREYRPKYIDEIKFLIKNGYHKSYNDVYYETQTKISYFADTKSYIYIIIIIIVLMGIFGLIFSKIDPITIILLIGMPGALLSKIKGK